jgi:hypothetical protein
VTVTRDEPSHFFFFASTASRQTSGRYTRVL